ncbi:MAG: hypothetical protein Q9160_007453 [Pyrenula sp. 1 TL-2023]
MTEIHILRDLLHRFAGLDALKGWIRQHAAIPERDQILMTGRGKNVKAQNLSAEVRTIGPLTSQQLVDGVQVEIFVYDKQIVTPSANGLESPRISEIPLPQPLVLSEPPSRSASQSDLQAWRDLFKSRRDWMDDAVSSALPLVKILASTHTQIVVIQRAVWIAYENLKSHVGNILHRFSDTRKWARKLLRDQENALEDWQGAIETLRNVQVDHDFAFLLQRPVTPTRGNSRSFPQERSLHDLIDVADVRNAASYGSQASQRFRQQFQELEGALEQLRSDAQTVENEIRELGTGTSIKGDEDAGLDGELQMLSRKITTDYEHIAQMPSQQRSAADAARIANSHAKDLLPSVKSIVKEVNENVKSMVDRRNTCLRGGIAQMQNISIIQSGLARIQAQVLGLDMDQDGNEAFDTLDAMFRLPVVYGSVLIEAIRRQQWDSRLRADFTTINEDLSVTQDEEVKRRKKWLYSIAGYVHEEYCEKAIDLTIPINESNAGWPVVSRQQLSTYLEELQAHGIKDAHAELTRLVKELDVATTHRRRPRAFKNGSVSDAELGRSSLLGRSDDDQSRLFKEEKFRLEEKLKSSESRIRKLEDLVHRQGQLGRPLSGNFSLAPHELERHAPSPAVSSPMRPDMASRRSSVSSRRLSSNQNLEEKALVQRIVALEADLVAERDVVSRLQRETHAERRSNTESRDKMEEAESTKRDLLANLESLQSEFDDERQLLDDEIHKLKIRVEEADEEIDRLIGSRDHEKMTTDRTIQSLQSDVSHLRRSLEDEKAQAEGNVDFVRNDLIKQQERTESLERQLHAQKEDKAGFHSQNMALANRLRDIDNLHLDYKNALQAAHLQLSPEGSPPEDLGRLVRAIEILAEGLSIHARNSDEAAQLASAENKSLLERIEKTERDSEHLTDAVGEKSRELARAQETLTEETNKVTSLRSELDDEQTELVKLRSKFAAGETGSDALKDRVAAEERKVAELSEELAVAKSNVESSAHEVKVWKGQVTGKEESERLLRARLDARGAKAKELSQRLFAQNDRFVRILEQMGFVLTPQDDGLRIQRASKVNASAVLGSSVADAPPLMNRSLSGGSPVRHYSPSELESLYWMSSLDVENEDVKFEAFIASVSRLDLDSTTELIGKRYKDVESLARKYQRDCRAYREKAHRAQSEAHEKIAYRAFKEGDLALFLPTRNQASRPWAAFNVGAPHFFLREQDGHKLQTRDWLLARISKVEERVVDLSRSMVLNAPTVDRKSLNTEASEAGSSRSIDDDNPFELSDGLRWYLIDAAEEKPGAPSTPGLGKSTVAATKVEATGSVRLTQDSRRLRDSVGTGGAPTATKTLSRSLDSRRSSSASKKGHVPTPSTASVQQATGAGKDAPVNSSRPSSFHGSPGPSVRPSEHDEQTAVKPREDDRLFQEVRRDLWSGP